MVSDIETIKLHPIYHDLTDKVVTVEAGSRITPVLTWSGEWMHAYIYIDYNDDKVFNYDINSDGTPAAGSEIVSYTYYHPTEASTGKNSLGENVSNSGGVTASNVPYFVIPLNAKLGDHRMRVKVDWCCIDPCADKQIGSNSISDNGGSMADITVRITAPGGVDGSISDGVSIFGGDRCINVNTEKPINIEIFDNGGLSLKEVTISGTRKIEINSGFYIVRYKENSVKVSVK